MANRRAPSDRSKRPLGAVKLDELALAYVARFATSRAKLTRYLSRKVRESEWVDGFARRRRFGPFATHSSDDPKQRERQIAAFLRAGHSMTIARRILAVPPGDEAGLAALDDEAALD